MQSLYQDKDGVWQVHAGCSIDPTITEAIQIAHQTGKRVTFRFNDVIVNVDGDSDQKLILRDWMRCIRGYTGTNVVDAHPKAELSPEEKESDSRIEAENERRMAEEQAEYDRQQKAKEEAMAKRMESVPAIELKPGLESEYQSYKDKNSDPYGGAVVTYGERWARLMQAEFAAGKKITEVADQASRDADIEGITGFMYGCAVQALAHFWKHGESLRLWHNRTIQIGTEGDEANDNGGVLNPAVLTIK
jgi:hypothetical protein